MVELATRNAAEAGVDNVEFLEGMIEDLPLPDASVDVVISNCVINLAPDKAPGLRRDRPGPPPRRAGSPSPMSWPTTAYTPPADGTAWADCGAGGLHHGQYLEVLNRAGLHEAEVERTHETSPGLHAAIVRAVKPA